MINQLIQYYKHYKYFTLLKHFAYAQQTIPGSIFQHQLYQLIQCADNAI